ncbi:MAG: biopolymer transporter ExbD [Verrucomicrobia bacterium]|jgi:biopolymer transport protein ExbD|nr:MAG: biopolymer transporter ExbD [Verrucomicrobiota bacterium]MDH4470084.1 biopolymer transporter ExbD [Verrucomicrobiae bacterium]
MRFYTKKRRIPSITIVSLIDILAILLIFFIVTSTFRKKLSQLQINLPESKSGNQVDALDHKNILLEVQSEEKMTLDGHPVTPATLAEELQEIQKTNPGCMVTMQADKGAPFGAIVSVLDALQAAGIKNIPTMTRTSAP